MSITGVGFETVFAWWVPFGDFFVPDVDEAIHFLGPSGFESDTTGDFAEDFDVSATGLHLVHPGDVTHDAEYGLGVGVDDDGDGFGDTPFKVYWVDYGDRNITCYDNHPLMELTAIPKFPLWIILPLFLAATLFVFIVFRKRLYRRNS